MGRFNNGTVFTNQNCIACNKCIAECHVFGSNVCVSERRKSSIVVDSNKCTHCGRCIDTCPQQAREYHDDTEAFFEALNNKEKITVILSPTFSFFYENEASQIIGSLKSLGIDKVYDASIGDDIAAWATAKYIKDQQDPYSDTRKYIANTCPSAINKILKYNTELVDKILPIQSPAVCSAIYIKKYLQDTNKIAFIGPCIAEKHGSDNNSSEDKINYVLTYRHLLPKLREMELSKFNDTFDETPIKSNGRQSFHANFKKLVGQYFPENIYFTDFEGRSDDIYDLLSLQRYSRDRKSQPYLVDIVSCKNGCHEGPAVEKGTNNLEKILLKYVSIAEKNTDKSTWEEKWAKACEIFKDLKPEDFSCNYNNTYKQPYNIPSEIYDDIFNLMLKTTEPQRHIDCGSCGYKSCHEMAKAIAYGINKKENCIHYMNQQLYLNLTTDKETGLPNRAGFISQCVEMMMKNPQIKYTIFLGDINRLKIINDLYSMKNGDGVLRTVGDTLRNVSVGRGLAGRLGGGTFAVCIENTEENIKDVLDINFFDCKHLGIEFPVTMRFGVFSQTESNIDIGIMMNGATICMDKNVSQSQNTYTFFNERFRKNTQQEIEITSKIQQALANHEFILWFQPQYKANTGELTGAEVLCRWSRPDGTILQPDLFIPIAEKNGYIRKLDIEIWRLAFSTMHTWIARGLPILPISVNISRVSLQNDSFIYTIMNLARDYDVPPRLIHFEITESAYISDQKNMITRINKLRNLGYKIAMDDFGSGYSSLNTLKDMPIDILKLDMGFLRDQTNMDKGGRIISSLAQMAQSLEYTTIAEGVETQEQADFLKGIGIDIFQGYLYSKPIPEAQFLALITNQSNKTHTQKQTQVSLIDINNFYNPASTESIMFDKILGPAALFEYKITNNKMSILKVNHQALVLFGLENLSYKHIQKSLEQYFSEESRDIFKDTIQKAISTDSEAICVLHDKEFINEQQIFIKLHISVISKKDDSYFILVNMEDVTEEIMAESMASTSNNFINNLMDNSLAPMCLISLKIDLLALVKKVQFRFLKVNKQLTELFGYSDTDMLKITEKQLIDIVHPFDRTPFLTKAMQAYSNGFTKPYSFIFRAKNTSGKHSKLKVIVQGIKQEDGAYLLFATFVNQDL